MLTRKEIQDAVEEMCGPLLDAHYVDVSDPFLRVFITDYHNKHEYAQRFALSGGQYYADNIEWKPLKDEEEYEWEENFPHPVPDWVANILRSAFTTFCLLI